MELLQLKYFCDAAVRQNFSDVAKQYHVPPSSVSQSIKRLETELSVQLFDRTSNRVCLNPKGQIFYQKVKTALEMIDDATDEISEGNPLHDIRIAINVNRRLVMQAVELFREKYPNVHINIKHTTGCDCRQYHLVISDETMPEESFGRKKILSEQFYLAVSRKNPLSEKAVLTAGDLCGQPFVTMPEGSSQHTVTGRICQELGFVPYIAIQSDDPFYVRECVELGLGVSVIPAISWKGQFTDNVILKEISDYKRNTFIYWNKSRHMEPHIRAFIDLLVNLCANELQRI